jgi:hypothetical protein
LLPIFGDPHTKKEKIKKKKTLVEENPKNILVRRGYRDAQKMAKD